MSTLVITSASSPPTTKELVHRCLRDDSWAWETLVDRFVRLVYAIGVRHGLTPDEVEDVAQEVFLTLAQTLHTIDDPERLPSWLMTTTRRLCWRAVQRRRREHPMEEADLNDSPLTSQTPLIEAMPTMDEIVLIWHRQETLAIGLAHLNARCRELLTLLFLEEAEPSYDAISQISGIPKGSIGPTRIRCLQHLRSILEGLGYDGESIC